MAFVRGLSLVLIAIGLMLLGADIISTLEMKALMLRSLDHDLALVSLSPKASLDARPPAWWVSILSNLLAAPAWLLPAVLGGLFGYLSAPRKKKPAPPPPPPPE